MEIRSLKIKVLVGLHSFWMEAMGENPYPWNLWLLLAACIPWCVAFFSNSKAYCATSSNLSLFLNSTSIVTFLSLTLTLLPPSFLYKETCDHNEPTQIIQGNFLISRSLTSLHLQSHFYYVGKYIHTFLGLGYGHTWGVSLQGSSWCLLSLDFCYSINSCCNVDSGVLKKCG